MARTEHADDNPCTRCGACCASFRVDFAADELLSEGGSVPDGLADPLTGRLWRLRGTDHARPRCAALQGTVGQQVRCGIHEWRPSPCREFGARAPFGQGDDACTRARARHGLPPLTDEPAADVSVGRVAAPFGSRRGRPGCAS